MLSICLVTRDGKDTRYIDLIKTPQLGYGKEIPSDRICQIGGGGHGTAAVSVNGVVMVLVLNSSTRWTWEWFQIFCTIYGSLVAILWYNNLSAYLLDDHSERKNHPMTWILNVLLTTWAVGSCSSGPLAAGTVETKSTGGSFRPEWSPCTTCMVKHQVGWFWLFL